MPTVLRSGRFVVKVWGPPREHAPPHAHVYVGRDGLVVVRLSLGPDRPAKAWSVEGDVTMADARAARQLVEQNERRIRAEWERIHGTRTD